jgi:phosphopantothenoylcysteine decarboxylase / phosphopantothenate---cysteine ligase
MDTASGLLACDRVGAGRMAEPWEIVSHIQSLLYTGGIKDFVGKKILISAGGTREFLDPVRYIGNPSTGKMGLALAQAALHRGAEVTLVHGPANLDIPLGVEALPVNSAEEMQNTMVRCLPKADVIFMSAAVADVKPRDYSSEKLAKRSLPESLPLTKVPDIVAELSQLKNLNQKLIGFAAQTGDIVTPALEKLLRKNLDAIVANPIDKADSGFGSDNNQAVFLDREGKRVDIPNCSKLEMAHCLLNLVA